MAKLRRPIPALRDHSALPPDCAPIALSDLVGPTARRPGQNDPRRDRVWLDLRAEIGRLLMCSEFDPRKDLPSGDAAHQAARHEARLLHLAQHYKADPRVTTEDGGR